MNVYRFHVSNPFHPFVGAAVVAALAIPAFAARPAQLNPVRLQPRLPAAVSRAAVAPPLTTICILPNGTRQTITLAPGQNPTLVCPIQPPANAPVDTNSDQNIYGYKFFVQPLGANITGNAVSADTFNNPLAGDISGTQYDTHVANVPVSALPAIGFGITPSAPKIKYVDGDADDSDPRSDGSLAHPYRSLTVAAAGVRDGDRLIVHGNVWGYAVFANGVTVEGASNAQTVIHGSLIFNGYQASTVRNLHLNCTSDTACVSNMTSGGADLILDQVMIAQSYSGPAVEAVNGRVIAYGSRFSAIDGASAVAHYAGANTSRFINCDFTSEKGSALLVAEGARVEIDGSRLSVTGDQPAVRASGAASVRVLHSDISAIGSAFYFHNSYNTLIAGSWVTSDGGDKAVQFDNAPRLTLAASTERRIVIDNYFRTGGNYTAIGCLQSDELFSRGNVNLDHPVVALAASATKGPSSSSPIILPPPPPFIQPVCTMLSFLSF